MKNNKQSKGTTNKKESSSLSTTIAKGVVKLIFESLNRTIKDWETRSSVKEYKEITRRYELFEKRMHDEVKELKNRVEKLTIRIFWLNSIVVMLLILVILELILLLTG
jgi:tetrahydromethanopterin S-methyltransferase subunit G